MERVNDYSKLTSKRLEQKMSIAKEIKLGLARIDVHHLNEEELKQYKERREKLGSIIIELDKERLRRSVKDADEFLESLDQEAEG